jgi:hypothetical protein
MAYVVMVNDDFHYKDESERYRAGEFATAEEAVARCRQIDDEYLDEARKIENSTATALGQNHVMFGEDPFVIAQSAEPVRFGASTHASARRKERCGGRIENGHPSRRDPACARKDSL